jgi:hypothetical protein
LTRLTLAPVRKAFLVTVLAVAALAAVHGSAGAQPGPDDDPNYNHPMWIYANPANVSRQAASDPEPTPWFDAGEQAAGTR